MKNPLAIITPLGETVEVKHMYLTCMVEIEERVLLADLIELVVLHFDVIVGMDWLSENHATIDYFEKCILFARDRGKEFILQCDRSKVSANLMSMITSKRLQEKKKGMSRLPHLCHHRE